MKRPFSLKIFLIFFLGIAAIFILVSKIDLRQLLQPRATGQPADLVLDLNAPTRIYPPLWRFLAQGGENKDYRFKPIVNQLRTLSPVYIRLDHLYDFYDIVSRNQEGRLVFSWAKLDTMIRDIFAAGARPFLSLSYMPPSLSDGDIVGAPKNWGEWQTVVRATVEHVSGRRGLNLPGVYYEVWNEPDLFGDWKTYGAKNYLLLYQFAAQGAQSAQDVQKFYFGGPATTALYPNWTTQFLNFVREKQLRLDFYSWHRYSSDPDQFAQDGLKLGEELALYPEFNNLEKVISEWGPDSRNSSVYDGNYAAAHLVASLSQMFGVIDKPFIFEVQDGLDPAGKEYWGRWGLLTHQSFGSRIKPRFQAISLFGRLRRDYLELAGQGSWVKGVATREGSLVQLLLTNFDPQGRHYESVPVTCLNVPPGTYRLTQVGLSGKEDIFELNSEENFLKFMVNLPPNAVMFIELAPLVK